jgi:hypothetical protein
MKTFRISFPRRVRIHGGECGAVARALHHEVKSLSLPAVKENVFFTTNERKSMSTKTSLLKRIAQTAVVALLGGLFSTLVAAPSANAAANSSISATCTARAGLGASIVVTVNGDNAQKIYATQSSATLSTESATSSVSLDATVHSTIPETMSTQTGIMIDGDIMTKKYATITYLVWLDNLANGTNSSTPRTTPNGGVAADPFTTVVCTLAGAPVKFALSSASASVASLESATFTITPQDAAGNSTLLAQNETITLTSNFTTAAAASGKRIVDSVGALTGYATGALLPVANDAAYISGQPLVVHPTAFNEGLSRACNTGSTTSACSIELGANNADGVSAGATDDPSIQTDNDTMTATGAFTVNVTNTAAATTTWTVRGSGTVPFISAAASTFTLTTVTYTYGACYGVGSATALGTAGSAAVAGGGIIDGNQIAPANTPDKTGTASACLSAGASGPAIASDAYTVSTAKKDVTITWQLTAAGTLPVTVAATSTTSSTPAGITLETVSLYSGTDTHVSMTLTATAPVSGQSYKVTWNSAQGVARTLTLTYADPVVNSTNGSATLSPASGKALTGGTVAVDALVRDQFNSLVNNATVLFSVTGRNATTSAVAKTTNASGVASYSFVDDGTPATTLSDSVSATAQTAGAATSASATAVSFTWTASLAVGVLRVTNDADADGVAVDGGVTFTATATDSSGVALSGYPVTFTGDAKTYQSSTANSIVAYTNTSGVATATFDGKTVGTATVTVTSGGKTATSSFDILAGTARTISLDASTVSMAAGASKRVTATVKDRYGNGIEDAAVTVTYVGTTGRVASVNGIAASSGTADADGKVVIEISSDAAAGVGTGTLTVKFTGGNTSTATVNDDGSALPARVASATAAITVTAADSSVVDAANAANDAAAEAIDAANAATDAANLAAEAADAATVAAEEARDAADAATAAVEELATQVATLMAALKAQITTLANTVAKIAKKVKA